MMRKRGGIYFDNFKASAGLKLLELHDLNLKSSQRSSVCKALLLRRSVMVVCLSS